MLVRFNGPCSCDASPHIHALSSTIACRLVGQAPMRPLLPGPASWSLGWEGPQQWAQVQEEQLQQQLDPKMASSCRKKKRKWTAPLQGL